MIVIIDYGVGNLTSIKNMIKKCGSDAVISSDVNLIASATKFILPGVGSFDYGIENLKKAPFFSSLQERILQNKIPVLGVCLGAQLLLESSEEGSQPGLGWIKGSVKRFDKGKFNEELKIPHMGWSEVKITKDSDLFRDMYADPRFYFVHSYHIICNDQHDELLTCKYGYTFTAGIERGNILGVQFHPEKSHKYGMKLYENFIRFY